jgi:hypothetical protein
VIPDINSTLYATNLGPHGPSVLRYAQSLARVHEAKIVLLHVLEPLTRHARHVIDQFLPRAWGARGLCATKESRNCAMRSMSVWFDSARRNL